MNPNSENEKKNNVHDMVSPIPDAPFPSFHRLFRQSRIVVLKNEE